MLYSKLGKLMLIKSLATLLLLLSLTSPIFAGQSPLETTKAFVASMKSVKTDGVSSYPKIDAFINFDHLTTETIRPHLKSFNETQVNTFKPLLQQLIRLVAYPQSGDFYSDSKYTYRKPTVDGDKAYVVMDVIFEKEDLEIELGYFWQKKDDNWLLTDLSFDEDSLVKDYQNQFGRIISKESVDSLNQKLQNKLTEIEKENKK